MYCTWKRPGVGLWTLLVLGAALAVPLSKAEAGKPKPPPPPAPFAYEMVLIPKLTADTTAMFPFVMNNDGDVPGSARMSTGPGHAWLLRAGTTEPEDLDATILGADYVVQWRGGVPVPDLDVNGHFVYATLTAATAINDVGQICGHMEYVDIGATLRFCAFRYTPALGDEPPEILILDVPPGRVLRYVWEINLRGDVLCASSYGPFVCLSEGGITDLEAEFNGLNFRGEYASINDAGKVVFAQYSEESYTRGTSYPWAYLYDPGPPEQITYMGALNPNPPNLVPSSLAYCLNDEGQATGHSIVDSEKVPAWGSYRAIFHAFRYKDGVMVDLGVPPGYTRSIGYWINNQGDVVGRASLYVKVKGGEAFVSRPCLYTEVTGMIELWPLITGDTHGINAEDMSFDWYNDTAHVNMNDAGDIAAHTAKGAQAFILKRVLLP